MSENTSLKDELTALLQALGEVFVVYLDDEADLLDGVEHTVLESGLKFFGTTRPDDAVKFIATHRSQIGLILSDLRMPEVDGFAFREMVKPVSAEVPFAVLSAHIDTEIALKGVELKICAFLNKPLTADKLNEVITREALPRLRTLKDDKELRTGFVMESEGLLSEAEELLLAIDRAPDDENAINRYFGIIHTLKGASGYFEPKTLHKFVHKYEDLLKQVQRKEIQWSEGVSAAFFRGFDTIKILFEEFRSNQFAERNLEQLFESLAISQEAHAASITETKMTAAVANAPQTARAAKQEDVRVPVSILNQFMQLSGEVTVLRNMINKCVRSIERQYSGNQDVIMLSELLGELHKINGGMQNTISDIRKIPIRTVVKAIPRAVRDVSKTLGKKVKLDVIGEDLLVDTAIAEVLNNSVLHLVKNSLDHGLEIPEKRIAAGKPEEGKVSIRCSHANEKVIVEIEDDGRGISIEGIKAKLLKNGSHTQAQIDAMSEPELYAMIFAPGFSTAAQVTDISGRGVGMSMVKDSIDAIKGEIRIESKPGLGAKFSLVLPVPKSVMIGSCLFVRLGKEQFGFMQDDILRVVQIDRAQEAQWIRRAQGSEFFMLDGELIPLARLSEIFEQSGQKQEKLSDPISLVTLQDGQGTRKLAVCVDSILDSEDTVIKGMPASWNRKQLFRGATYLDDGTLGLILNTEGLMEAANLHNRTVESKKVAVTQQTSNADQRAALLISLAGEVKYAIPQEEIRRIEEFKAGAIQISGSTLVIPYRDGILPLYDVRTVFGEESGWSISSLVRNSQASCTAVVVKHKDRSCGLIVDSVQDIATFDTLNTELAQPSNAILGHFFYQERIMNLIDVSKLIEIANTLEERVPPATPETTSVSIPA